MVDIVSAAPATALRITVRPNSAVNGRWRLFVLVLLLPLFSAIGAGFVLLGAWPVAPCLALALGGLWLGLRQIERHAGDFERIVLCDDRLLVDRHDPRHDEHLEFNSLWVQVVTHGDGTLALRSHGCEFPVGNDLTESERVAVGRELRSTLARARF